MNPLYIICIKLPYTLGAWVAQLIKPQTLDFSSGRDLGVLGTSPMWGSVLGTEPACPSPSAPSPYALSLSQINKIVFKNLPYTLWFVLVLLYCCLFFKK